MTRLENRIRLRFQSNHQRGYFCRKTSMSTSGTKTAAPPITKLEVVEWSPSRKDSPDSIVTTTTIGIATMNRNAVVSRLSDRDG